MECFIRHKSDRQNYTTQNLAVYSFVFHMHFIEGHTLLLLLNGCSREQMVLMLHNVHVTSIQHFIH